MSRVAIAIDFDGVIHQYSRGWADGTAYDDPVPGALKSIRDLLPFWNIFILSTREPHDIEIWLKEHNAPFPCKVIVDADVPDKRWTVRGVVGITDRKLVSRYFIDDRAIVFDKNSPREWDRILNVLKVGSGRGP